MSVFEIEAPNGKVYEVEGPNAEGAFEALKQHLGGLVEPSRQAPEVPDGMIWNPETNSYLDAEAQAARMGSARGAAASYLAGTPFVGEFFDEALGAVDGALTGRPPEFAQEVARISREKFAEENPKTATGLEIAGGIVGSAPLAVAAVPAVTGAGSALGMGARGAALGAGAGAAEGAAAGYGRGKTAQERRRGAAQGALVGGAAGGALGAAAPALGYTASALYKRVRKADVRAIAAEFGIDTKSARALRDMIASDDLEGAAARLSQIGDDAMIADIGPAAGQALDTVTQTGGEALRIGKEAVESRAAKVGGQVTSALDRVLGAPDGMKGAAREISGRTARARDMAYRAAFDTPIDYSSAAGRKLEGIFDRVPSETMRRALKEANEAMIEAGLKNEQILAEIAEDGAVVFREMPNVRQLDELKRALSQIAQNETDEFGRKTSGVGLRAARLAQDLRRTLGEAVPQYDRAVKLGGDKIAEDSALRMGRDLLSRRVSLEDVRTEMASASREARQALSRGLRENIEDTLSNVRRTITDPNGDAREAMKLVKDLSSRANRSKLTAALGERTANRLLAEVDKAAGALELRAMIATNSKTAIRQAGREGLDAAASGGPARELMQGNPIGSAQRVVQALTGATDEAALARRADVAAQIAKALTGKRGREAQKALRVVRKAIEGQPLKDAEAAAVAKAVGSSASLGGYQLGMQNLER